MMPSTLLAVFLAVVAAATAGDELENGGAAISGLILNATCLGPCSEPPPPLPIYDGKNLVVVIRTLPERALVARVRPKDALFALAAEPGRYRVRARITETGGADCWEGSAKSVEVSRGVISRVWLRMTNGCVL